MNKASYVYLDIIQIATSDFEMSWSFTKYFIYMLLLCSSLGRPRRFSEQFLIEEKHKLNLYRESVRSHYAEVLAGTKEGLPADLAQPLIVGQRVIAIHPKTREIHDGSILTVDHCRYRVQFDQHELGVEFVMVCFLLFFDKWSEPCALVCYY
jgi:hypothetical protein